MTRYLTAAEIAVLYRRPIGTIYRLASQRRWRRVADGRRPALYAADDVARTFQNLARALSVQRRSLGSVIGRLDSISVHKRRLAGVWDSITGLRVEVTFTDNQVQEIKNALGKRVEIFGLITRDFNDNPLKIKMRELEVLPDVGESPSMDSIYGMDPDFTGGRSSVDYVREMRGASYVSRLDTLSCGEGSST